MFLSHLFVAALNEVLFPVAFFLLALSVLCTIATPATPTESAVNTKSTIVTEKTPATEPFQFNPDDFSNPWDDTTPITRLEPIYKPQDEPETPYDFHSAPVSLQSNPDDLKTHVIRYELINQLMSQIKSVVSEKSEQQVKYDELKAKYNEVANAYQHNRKYCEEVTANFNENRAYCEELEAATQKLRLIYDALTDTEKLEIGQRISAKFLAPTEPPTVTEPTPTELTVNTTSTIVTEEAKPAPKKRGRKPKTTQVA